MCGRRAARLTHARVEAEVADELAPGWEAADVADGGQERRGDDHVDARDGHQPPDLRRGKRRLGDRPLDRGDLLVEKLDLAQTAVDRLALIDRQLELAQPSAAGLAEQVADRGLCDQTPDQRRGTRSSPWSGP